MPDNLQKLRPDRDLQCYFERPSAIAAMSEASASGFTVSGTWRQQFDWAVIEWNRDNTFEHPLFRNLPDGDLSGLHLTYEETRQDCIPLDSNLFPTVDWPYLRVWATSAGVESVYKVPLKAHATAVTGRYTPASAVFELQGTVTPGDYVELAWETEHYTYLVVSGDTLSTAATAIAAAIEASSPVMSATSSGALITLSYLGDDGAGHRQSLADSTTGVNGNRLGVYGNVSGAVTESWQPAWQQLSGGTSPGRWRITLDFGTLKDKFGVDVPTSAVRKLRWTYAADMQSGGYLRTEFQAVVSNWTVTGSGRDYQVAGELSRRIEDDAPEIHYSGLWDSEGGNYSGGSIHFTTAATASFSCSYKAGQSHSLYLGTRKLQSGAHVGAQISITIDGGALPSQTLIFPEEDVLVRIPLGTIAGGVTHNVTVTHAGLAGTYFYFDFLEIALPTGSLPVVATDSKVTLATDWDTDHSIALPAERSAWLIRSLGFTGRANHYMGALWFYELMLQGHSFASGTVTFSGSPVFSLITELSIGIAGSATTLQHLNLIGDTASSIARAFELRLNNGFTAVRASASGSVLTIYSRAMGEAGNALTLTATPSGGTFSATASGALFTGGVDGAWRTDLGAVPRINRAARDWSRSFIRALHSYGIDCASAFSMELQHGDPSTTAGIAQRYADGMAVQLNTPALQTNFSPTSLAFWRQVYLDMADVMSDAGMTPYLQFGEVQWWYFVWDHDPAHPHSSLPLYDAYTTTAFQATFGGAMHVFANSEVNPALYPDESQFLAALIGAFTNGIISYVRAAHSDSRFEVLYPPDVNDSPLNKAINLPAAEWTSTSLDCLKTENFTFTGNRNLNQARDSILLPMQMGFPRSKGSHLVGIGDYTTPWEKEVSICKAEGVESIVLFALDQFCLIGYPAPLDSLSRRSSFQG